MENLLKLGKANSSAAQRLAVLIFRQIGVAAKNVRRPLHRLGKRQILEGMQRVVVNENRDRPLRRKQVRRMLDRCIELVQGGRSLKFVVEGRLEGTTNF